MILCDECDRGYHLFCLTPPLSTPPKGFQHFYLIFSLSIFSLFIGKWMCTKCLPKELPKPEIKTELDPTPPPPKRSRLTSPRRRSPSRRQTIPVPSYACSTHLEPDVPRPATPEECPFVAECHGAGNLDGCHPSHLTMMACPVYHNLSDQLCKVGFIDFLMYCT